MAKTKLLRYNVKNVKYAIRNSETGYGEVKDLSYVDSISLEPQYEETKVYGDGEIIGVIPNDKGLQGKLKVININEEYEKDCGRLLEIQNGTASIQQRKTTEQAIYFEVDATTPDGRIETIKNWLFGVTTGKPSESFDQTKDAPTINNYEYNLTIKGDILRSNTQKDIYIDKTTGNVVKVYWLKSGPSSEGYATFGNNVPTPIVKNGELS